MTTPADPLYSSQWHFPLLGDIETIWDEYTGAGVSVGVFDDGVEYTHPDLSGNYDPSQHFQFGGTTYDPMPLTSGDAHGTAVAGLIAASEGNGIGGVGVAWDATLTGVNFLGDIQYQSFSLLLASLDWARNFDIMSNSWGRTPAYESNQSLASAFSARSLMNAEYEDVVTFGRGGLGTVITQAAGNDANDSTLQAQGIYGNANGDGLNSSRFTATIAATDSSGNITYYSNYGASILVAAPAGSVTTDLQGSAGYNSSGGTAGDYTTTFGGTSAATPVTSGVVALMLEANPGLGWRDVQNILAISAAQTGSAYGGSGTGYEVGDWGANGAGNWNGGGMSFHASYGFGMVDAFAAVRMAEVWSTLFGSAATSANEQTTSVSMTGPAQAIPDYSGGTPGQLDIALTVTQDIRIEDIYVTVDITHSYSSDLTLTLIGPNGEEIPLMSGEGGSTLMDSGFEWTFGVTAALGMMSAGTWTLRITDNFGSDVGSVSDVTIDFYGAADSNDDVYHFTQDLFDLIAVEATRATISDTNGGTDWLNFAAMGAINVTVRLDNMTVAFSSDPTILTLAPGSDFENVVTGDGNDEVIGNTLGNEILGMRGNDTLSGGQGDDSLLGGTGNDSLVGGKGEDTLEGGDDDDYLYGAKDDDHLDGGAGSDTLSGGSGNDTLVGGSGDDTLLGRDGLDHLTGDAGEDFITGEDGNDTLIGGDDDDYLDGGIDNDMLFGNDDNDYLIGRRGDDSLEGGAGNDTMNGGSFSDTLIGGSGNDYLYGANGVDTINGGSGDDTLSGGKSVDTFVFEDGFGTDLLIWFQHEIEPDLIDLSGVSAITDYADLTNAANPHIYQNGNHVIIDDHAGNTILLTYTQLSDLDASHFIF